jgi:hypothetical protein
LSRIYERRRSLAVVFLAALIAMVALSMASMSTARADTAKCDRAAFADDTGYLACLSGSGADRPVGPTSGGSGGASSEDLPVTGNNPVKYLVAGSACIVVGAAAVVGSLQTPPPKNPSF